MKKLGLILLVLAIVGAGFYFETVRSATPEVTLVTENISRGDIVESVSASGTLEAVETVDVGTQVSGVVAALHADFNSIVRKGQVIARLDRQLFQTQIEQQNANVSRAAAEVERLRVGLADASQKLDRATQLAAKGLVPATELDTATVNVKSLEAQIRSAEASLAQARAQLNNARVNLNYTTITAPIDGIVISRNVDQGQTVAASMNAPTLYVIAADLTRMQVIASIDESDVGRMRPGQPVTFRVDAFPDDVFTGVVSQVRLQPTVVQNVVTYSTVISVSNPALKLKPGMTANLNIEVTRRSDIARIPNASLRFRPTPETFAALNQPLPQGVDRNVTAARGPKEVAADATPAAATAPSVIRTAAANTTVDALFAPLEPTEARGAAWVLEEGQLKMVSLRLGISDGTFTEVLNPADVPAGGKWVTGVASGAGSRSTTQNRQSNPLMGPQPPVRGRAGG